MSGAQGAQPPGSLTATTYETVEGEKKAKPKLHLLSKEDEGGVQVEKLEEKVPDPIGAGGPVFGAGKDEDENKQDLGATGTGTGG